jgi:hypothetical protein
MIDFGKLVMAGQAAPMAIWLRDRGTERPTMLAELFAAAEDWRHSGKRLDLGRALALVDPSLVDPLTGLPRGSPFGLYRELLGIHFFQDIIDQLRPLSETQGAIALASMLGLEPWYVFATVYPRRVRREEQDPTELDVPEEVIQWIGNWALGLQMIDVAGQAVLPEYIGRPVTAEPMVWPALLALRERIPHPLLIDEPERTDFIAAVEQWDRRIDERMFLIERASLAWVERYGEPPRSFARLRSGRPWRPWHYPDTFDPADGVLPQLLRAAVALVKGWGDQTPTLFSSAKVLEIWESSRAALGPLVESAYARMIARVLDIEWALRPSRTSQSVSDDLVWRLVLLEAILRESAGAVRALVAEPLEWMAEYRDVMEQFVEWTARFLRIGTQGG